MEKIILKEIYDNIEVKDNFNLVEELARANYLAAQFTYYIITHKEYDIERFIKSFLKILKHTALQTGENIDAYLSNLEHTKENILNDDHLLVLNRRKSVESLCGILATDSETSEPYTLFDKAAIIIAICELLNLEFDFS